ncbi:MAG: hypothetical protein Q7S03_01475 [bacterium]|nr:hypothetical protein [bacterium]
MRNQTQNWGIIPILNEAVAPYNALKQVFSSCCQQFVVGFSNKTEAEGKPVLLKSLIINI